MITAKEFIKEIDKEGQEWSDDTEVLASHFEDYAKLYHKKRLCDEYDFLIAGLQHGTSYLGKSAKERATHEQIIYWLKERMETFKM